MCFVSELTVTTTSSSNGDSSSSSGRNPPLPPPRHSRSHNLSPAHSPVAPTRSRSRSRSPSRPWGGLAAPSPSTPPGKRDRLLSPDSLRRERKGDRQRMLASQQSFAQLPLHEQQQQPRHLQRMIAHRTLDDEAGKAELIVVVLFLCVCHLWASYNNLAHVLTHFIFAVYDMMVGQKNQKNRNVSGH